MLVVKTYTIMPAAMAIAMSKSVAIIGEIALDAVNRMFQSEGYRLYNPSEQLFQFGSPDPRVVTGELAAYSADNCVDESRAPPALCQVALAS